MLPALHEAITFVIDPPLHTHIRLHMYEADHPTLDESLCPECAEEGGKCVYYDYMYRCTCKKGFVGRIDYLTGLSSNNIVASGPENPHFCVDVDECR